MSSQPQQGLQRNAIGADRGPVPGQLVHGAGGRGRAVDRVRDDLALGITPLAVLCALIAALFTAFSMGELARHLPSAGGMYTYVGRGLGSSPVGSWRGYSFLPSPSCRRPCLRRSASSGPGFITS